MLHFMKLWGDAASSSGKERGGGGAQPARPHLPHPPLPPHPPSFRSRKGAEETQRHNIGPGGSFGYNYTTSCCNVVTSGSGKGKEGGWGRKWGAWQPLEWNNLAVMSVWQDLILFGKQTDPQSGKIIVSRAEETNKSICFNGRFSCTSLLLCQQQEPRRGHSGFSPCEILYIPRKICS